VRSLGIRVEKSPSRNDSIASRRFLEKFAAPSCPLVRDRAAGTIADESEPEEAMGLFLLMYAPELLHQEGD